MSKLCIYCEADSYIDPNDLSQFECDFGHRFSTLPHLKRNDPICLLSNTPEDRQKLKNLLEAWVVKADYPATNMLAESIWAALGGSPNA